MKSSGPVPNSPRPGRGGRSDLAYLLATGITLTYPRQKTLYG